MGYGVGGGKHHVLSYPLLDDASALVAPCADENAGAKLGDRRKREGQDVSLHQVVKLAEAAALPRDPREDIRVDQEWAGRNVLSPHISSWAASSRSTSSSEASLSRSVSTSSTLRISRSAASLSISSGAQKSPASKPITS